MLAPEVWAFQPPASSLKILEGPIDGSEEVENVIKSHQFNHLVSLVLPDTPLVPEALIEALSFDNDYYRVNNISVHELVKKEFIDAFVKEGHLSLLSIDNYIDLGNCIALLDNGLLVLSLNRESYQELGLEGKATLSKSKEHQRYIVTVDLKAKHFHPGKKNYERAYNCLRNCLQNFNIILAWEPKDEKLCPSSVASYLAEQGLDVVACKPRFNQRRDFNVDVPLLHPTDKECDFEEILEWLGACCLNVKDDSSLCREFLSSYQQPEETIKCGQVAFLCWEGLFTPRRVISLFHALSEYFKDREDIPWVSLYVQGFADVPVAWNLRPHSFFSDGDNTYTLILKPNKTFKLALLHSNSRMIK